MKTDYQNNRKYINAVFIKLKWANEDDPNNRLYAMNIKRDDFIRELKKLEEDADGYVHLTMGTQKSDETKMSVWLREPKPEDKQTPQSQKKQNYTPSQKQYVSSPKKNSYKTTQPSQVEDGVNELPF